MKIAFPTNKGEKIARHSSFCTSFQIIDTQTQEKVSIVNPVKQMTAAVNTGTDKHTGRHFRTGRIVSAILADAGVDIYVCYEAGEKFIDRLQRAGIAVYTTQERQIESALNEITVKRAERGSPDVDGRQGFGRRRGQGRGAGEGRRGGQTDGFGRGRGMRQGEGRGMRQNLGRGVRKHRCNVSN